MSIFSDEISEIHPELWAIDHPRPIYESAGLPGALEAIDALADPKSLNQDRKQYLEAISILTHGQERDSN